MSLWVKHIATALALVCGLATLGSGAEPAYAGKDYPKLLRVPAGGMQGMRPLKVGLNKSVVIELGSDVADVLVSNPAVADAVVRSSRRVYILGVAAGQANVFLFAKGGHQIASYELSVEPDTGDLQRAFNRLLPGTAVSAEAVNGSIVLSGVVNTPLEAKQAADIAAKFAGGDAKNVVSMIRVKGEEQVYLKVTIAEVQRSIVKQLGVDLSAMGSIGHMTVEALSENAFGVAGSAISDSALSGTYTNGSTKISGTIRALQEDGVIRTLAEPTLTAVSGESASFLVGGEFPVPVGRDEDGNLTVEFKKYGISLGFTPVVLSSGRISTRIKTEMSELTTDGAVTLSGGGTGNTLSIPGLRVRRADTTVELPSGGTLVMAGLIKDDVRQSINGIPGLLNLPVLGALFKSRDYQRSQSEFVVFVTPYLVDPAKTSAIRRPDQNLSAPSDAAGIFLNRLNRMYRVNGEVTGPGDYQGHIGFIYE